jgi:WD40 repeat protein
MEKATMEIPTCLPDEDLIYWIPTVSLRSAVMKFAKWGLLLILLLSACTSGCDKNQEQKDANSLADPAKIFPYWNQSWRCGKWRPVTYADWRNFTLIRMPDEKSLSMSLCGWCYSIRLINFEDRKERVILSLKARTKQCKHRWRPALYNWSFEPIESGDALFIIYDEQMYVLLVEKIFIDIAFGEKISYKIAKVTGSGSFPTKVRWKKLAWKTRVTEREIPIGSRKITFGNKRVSINESGDNKDIVSIGYDNYYGCWDDTYDAEIYEKPTRIAIVHKSHLENNPVVDLTKFRFKSWEDGLGNRCDSTPFDEPVFPEKVNFLNLHSSVVRDVAASPDGSYIASTGDDGCVVIQHLDESIKKIIGPFHEERLLCLAVSQDGTNVLAGGEFDNLRSILKINVADGKYQEIRVDSGRTMDGLSYCKKDTCIAFIEASNKLSFFDLEARTPLSSHRIFGGFTLDFAGSPDGNFFAVISMNEVGLMSAEPCKLTIFDTHGNETLSYQFESCREVIYSKIRFLAPDCLVLCLPTGKMWQWKWSSKERNWKIDEQLKIPQGPFSAISSSFNGKIVWLAQKQSVLAIDTTTGETIYESSFDIGKCNSKFMAEPITAIEPVPNKQTLVLGFCDGRVALMPIPEAVLTKSTSTTKNM